MFWHNLRTTEITKRTSNEIFFNAYYKYYAYHLFDVS